MNITTTILQYTDLNKSIYNIDKNTVFKKMSFNLSQNSAAIVIQKHVRVYLKKKGILSNNLLFAYKILCIAEPQSIFQQMPQVKAGASKVFLPNDFPEVVFKKPLNRSAKVQFKHSAEVRFRTSKKIQTILTEQKILHLIIPKAIRFGDFLVEDRLPITADTFYNMALYISQANLFNDAVREITRLFSVMFIDDLLGCNPFPLGSLPGVDYHVRYDNLPLFIVESDGIKKGAIGLIDLEHLSARKDDISLKTLVRIFPYHLNLIKQEADLLKMIYDNKELESAAIKGDNYLKLGYTNFLTWLQKKNIDNNPRKWKFTINTTREKKLRTLIELELIKLNQGINDFFARESYTYKGIKKNAKDFLKGDVYHTARELSSQMTPVILNCIVEVINKYLTYNIEKYSSEIVSIPSEPTIVKLRSMLINRDEFVKAINIMFYNSGFIDTNKFIIRCEEAIISDQLFYIIFTNLVTNGELFYYNPGYDTGNHKLSWIRF